MFHVKHFLFTMKKFTTKNQKIGELGEQIACDFIVKQGMNILETNYSCKFGEIDIIALRGGIIHFIEVKTITVPHETLKLSLKPTKQVSRETFLKEYRKVTNPFQNITKKKLHRITKTIQFYLDQKNKERFSRWKIDGIGIYLDEINKSVQKIEYIENINL